MSNKTLLVIYPGKDAGDCPYNLFVAETGEHLASHYCSHAGYAKSDLYTGREERIKEFTDRFGEIEVKFLEDTDLTWDEFKERNKQWYKALHPEKFTEEV
jgi:hypothetical protein